jgi:hypothetical protein
MPIDDLLSRLDHVKPKGPGRWMARCPAHEDRGPSLSLRELDDGRILLHCFGQGCAVEAIVGAVGLTVEDLFPPRPVGDRKPERRPVNAADALRAVGFEAMVVVAAASAILAGEPLAAVDRDRLLLASERIQDALRGAGL